MRVVVQVPDRDVPYVSIGNPAKVEIDACPARSSTARSRAWPTPKIPKRARCASKSICPTRRHAAGGDVRHASRSQLNQGKKLLTIPSSCLVGNVDNGKGTVFVVENGVAQHASVAVGADNG